MWWEQKSGTRGAAECVTDVLTTVLTSSTFWKFWRPLWGSLSMQRFWATDGHRKCIVFLFYLSSHYHIYIFKSLCPSRDDYFENPGETNVLACKMFPSGCRPWLKNVACLSSLLIVLSCTRSEGKKKRTGFEPWIIQLRCVLEHQRAIEFCDN